MPSSRYRKDSLLRSNIKQFLRPYFTFTNNANVEPLESWVFIAHYKFTVGVLICLFVSLVGGWLAYPPMECKLKYDRNEIEEYQEDLCLSYPYTYNNERERVYALHYKWVHWSILALIPLYSIPLHLKKHFEVEILNQYLYHISSADRKSLSRNTSITNLLDGFIGCGTGNLYTAKLYILFVNLFVDLVAVFFVDVTLQNRFLRLLPLDFPFTRWPQYFNDTMSLAFPPFVECKIGKEMLILNEMEETIGCSLHLMKVYDKVFVIMWVWMAALMLWLILTIAYYIILGLSKCQQRKLIKVKNCNIEVEFCVKSLGLGDLMLINCMQTVLTIDEKKGVLRKVVNKIKLCQKNNYVME